MSLLSCAAQWRPRLARVARVWRWAASVPGTRDISHFKEILVQAKGEAVTFQLGGLHKRSCLFKNKLTSPNPHLSHYNAVSECLGDVLLLFRWWTNPSNTILHWDRPYRLQVYLKKQSPKVLLSCRVRMLRHRKASQILRTFFYLVFHCKFVSKQKNKENISFSPNVTQFI